MNLDAIAWVVAIAAYVVGDAATTHYGLRHGAVERHPLAARVLSYAGAYGMVGVKVAVVAVAFAVYSVTPDTYAAAIPIGLAIVGVGVTAWNAYVIRRTRTP